MQENKGVFIPGHAVRVTMKVNGLFCFYFSRKLRRMNAVKIKRSPAEVGS